MKSIFHSFFTQVSLLVSSMTLCSAGVITYLPITDDADSGIDPANTYTHAIDFGTSGAAVVNGVEFSDGNPGEFPGAVGTNTVGTAARRYPTTIRAMVART